MALSTDGERRRICLHTGLDEKERVGQCGFEVRVKTVRSACVDPRMLRNLTSHNTSTSTSCKSRDRVPFGDVPAGEGIESLSEWLIQPCDGGQ